MDNLDNLTANQLIEEINKNLSAAFDEMIEMLMIMNPLSKMSSNELFEKLRHEFADISYLFAGIQNIMHPVEIRLDGKEPILEKVNCKRVSKALKKLKCVLTEAERILMFLKQKKKNGESANLDVVQDLLFDIKSDMDKVNRFAIHLKSEPDSFFNKVLIENSNTSIDSDELDGAKLFQVNYFLLMRILEQLEKIVIGFPGLDGLTFPPIKDEMLPAISAGLNSYSINFDKIAPTAQNEQGGKNGNG